MDEAFVATVIVDELVCRVQSREGIEHDSDGDGRRDLRVELDRRRNELGRRRALHVIHDEEIASLVFADFEDRDDVRMADARGETRLVEEHVDERGLIRKMRMQTFDRVEALETSWTSKTSEVH